jgi:ketosteroid isomerase-like protein
MKQHHETCLLSWRRAVSRSRMRRRWLLQPHLIASACVGWSMSGVMAEPEYADLADTIERTQRSVEAFVAGDPEPNKRLWSRSDDVTLANPFGGFRRAGRPLKRKRIALPVHGGSCVFEEVTRVEGSDVAYVFEIQRYESKAPGREGTSSLRVTMIFRLEEGGWKLVHRQADPLAESQPPQRSIQKPS